MEIIEKTLSEENIKDLKRFLSKYWRKDHPIVKSEKLLRWQYTGFGAKKGYDLFQLFYDDDKLVGIRGVIPQEMQIPNKDGEYEYATMGACAMWMVDPILRKQGKFGVGQKMHRNVEFGFGNILAIGANLNTSSPIFRRNGYFEKEALNRYIIPLSDEYNKMLISSVESAEIKHWIKDTRVFDKEYINMLENCNFEELEDIWIQSTNGQNILSVFRSKEFWKWRYGNSPYFTYRIFGGKDEGGIVVVRIEEAIKDIDSRDSTRVLRLIDLVPFKTEVWSGKTDPEFELLIENSLLWGKKNNCVAADFHCSTSRLEHVLFNIGFKRQFIENNDKLCGMSGLFQPITNSTYAFNCFLRLDEKFIYARNNFDYENTYIVRADSDQDRPNIIL